MIIPLFIFFAATQVLDVYTTWHILSNDGTEENPVMAWLIKTFGLIGGLAIPKVILVGWVGYVFACTTNPFNNSNLVSIAFLSGLSVIYTVVVSYNAIQLWGKK
jgi:hypothetical protein